MREADCAIRDQQPLSTALSESSHSRGAWHSRLLHTDNEHRHAYEYILDAHNVLTNTARFFVLKQAKAIAFVAATAEKTKRVSIAHIIRTISCR